MLSYGEVKKLQDGRYFAKVSNEDGKRHARQINNVILRSNLADTKNVILDVSRSADLFDEYKTQIVEAAVEKSEVWFSKALNQKTVEAAFENPVTQDGEITVSKVTPNVPVFDHTRTQVNTELPEDVVCDVILEYSGLVFNKKSFTAMWRIAQVKLKAPPKTKPYSEYMFEDEEEAQDSEEDFE
jgi:hypothetical protein